jgi:hypothetical protein
MKPHINIRSRFIMMAMFLCMIMSAGILKAQDEAIAPLKPKPVKSTFESGLIIDNQTVMVPKKGSMEMIIMHRFGTWDKGYEDFYGMFAPANISLGLTYVPIDNLQVGLSIIKTNMNLAGYAKYALVKQTSEWVRPVSVTYFGEMEIDTRKGIDVHYKTDRYMYFHQLLIARKITPDFSVQIAPSVTHVNVVDGYYSDSTTISPVMNHNHFAIAVSARYRITQKMNVMVNYDQPLTVHPSGNPYPNLSLGLEFSTSSHSFQVFVGNYTAIAPGRNNYYNKSGFIDADNKWNSNSFLIGFNIERLWNF